MPWICGLVTEPLQIEISHSFIWRAQRSFLRGLSVLDTAALMGHDPETDHKNYGSWTDEQGSQ
ncbi:MAG: hypothetical protein AB8B70_00350 [Prochlorococcus sp.]